MFIITNLVVVVLQTIRLLKLELNTNPRLSYCAVTGRANTDKVTSLVKKIHISTALSVPFLRPQVLMQRLAGFTWMMAVTCDDCHQTYILGIQQIITSLMTYFYFLARLSLTFVKLYQESKSHQRLCVYVLFFTSIIPFRRIEETRKHEFWITAPKIYPAKQSIVNRFMLAAMYKLSLQ